MNRLQVLFAQQKTLRKEFDKQKEIEWEALKNGSDLEIDREIVTSNINVRQLGLAMGTSDWRTAKRRHDQAHGTFYVPVETPEPKPNAALQWTYDEATDVWTALQGSKSVTVSVWPDSRELMVLSGDSELAQVVVQGGYDLWETATAGN